MIELSQFNRLFMLVGANGHSKGLAQLQAAAAAAEAAAGQDARITMNFEGKIKPPAFMKMSPSSLGTWRYVWQ